MKAQTVPNSERHSNGAQVTLRTALRHAALLLLSFGVMSLHSARAQNSQGAAVAAQHARSAGTLMRGRNFINAK